MYLFIHIHIYIPTYIHTYESWALTSQQPSIWCSHVSHIHRNATPHTSSSYAHRNTPITYIHTIHTYIHIYIAQYRKKIIPTKNGLSPSACPGSMTYAKEKKNWPKVDCSPHPQPRPRPHRQPFRKIHPAMLFRIGMFFGSGRHCFDPERNRNYCC